MTDKTDNHPDIKIFVACHKPSYVPENPYLYPIQVGAALADKRLENMLHDDEGENISFKNKSYCELTAQYWAWKNAEADYYGFFHYRRYFSFDSNLNRDDGWGNAAYDRITEDVIKELKLNPEDMEKLITQYDVIGVKGRTYPRLSTDGVRMDVYHEYGRAAFQHREDLDETLKVLYEKYPAYRDVAEEYMGSHVAHECNMFIMKKEIFHEYCSWLFDILEEVERRLDTTWYSVEEYRVFGYLAERLCAIYYLWLKKQKGLRVTELPKTLFHDTEPGDVIHTLRPEAVPVVLSANDKFAPYLDVMIRSIVHNASMERFYDIIILYNDIRERNQEMIHTAARGRSNVSIRFVKVDRYFDAGKLFVDQHLSVETYYRLIIPQLMPDYHKILYLDCDMVADRDVADLYDESLGDAIIGAVKDIDVAGQVNLKQNHWDAYAAKKVGLKLPYDYFQAGVLIINLDKLRELTTSQELIKLALSTRWRCHDQDVLNRACRGKVHYLPQRWNTLMDWREPDGRCRMDILKMAPRSLYEEYNQARKAPWIIHFAGYQKPWDAVDCDFADYFWKYAALSPFYPVLLRSYSRVLRKEEEEYAGRRSLENTPGIRKVANAVLPYGSRRRELVKKVVKKH